MHGSPWWNKTTIYQIYPRSFQDSNGDGIGDIPGILSRLDYLKGLGVETLWLSPVYSSPQEDFGYDISDYLNINPDYGTIKDFDLLLDQIHKRKMRLLMDMVLNHTSREHPWFIQSASSRENPRRDWYIWRDGKGPGEKKPPNNWQSQVSGSGWHRDPQSKQWYWASFLPFQPDLNWRNPAVREEMFRILKFWLDRGVDGYRLDILGSVYEDEQFRDNPRTWKLFSLSGEEALLFQKPVHTKNHPDNFNLARELRALTDTYTDSPRMLIGEVFGPPELIRRYCGESKPDGLHSVFLFRAAEIPFKAGPLRKILGLAETAFPSPWIPTLAFSNHDRIRRISALGGDPDLYRLSLLLQLTARGIPCLYYGEETGLPQARFSHKTSLDPVAEPFRRVPDPLFRFINRLFHGGVNRDECRTPMIWADKKNGGFCPPDQTSWLPLSGDPGSFSAAGQAGRMNSLLEFCRNILKLRKEHPALHSGQMEIISPGKTTNGSSVTIPRGILGYLRRHHTETLLVLINPGNFKAVIKKSPDPWEILTHTRHSGKNEGIPRVTRKKVTLPPKTGLIIKI